MWVSKRILKLKFDALWNREPMQILKNGCDLVSQMGVSEELECLTEIKRTQLLVHIHKDNENKVVEETERQMRTNSFHPP